MVVRVNMTSEPMLPTPAANGPAANGPAANGGGIFSIFRKTVSPPRNMGEMKLDLLEEGRLTYEDACILELVTKNKLPFDEYQELVSDRRNYNGRTSKFIVQVALTTGIAAFTITMLALGKPEGVYLPVLTGLIGYWLPSPDTSQLRAQRTVKDLTPREKP